MSDEPPPRKRMVKPPTGGTESGRAVPERLKTAWKRTPSQQAWLNRALYWPLQVVYTSIVLVPLSGRPLRQRAVNYMVAAAVSLVISLPLLPAAALARFPVQKVNYDLGEEICWPSQVALLARTYDALPASQRPVATVIAGNYGEAGAVDR